MGGNSIDISFINKIALQICKIINKDPVYVELRLSLIKINIEPSPISKWGG
jgi:hypothetical protein